MVNPRKPDPDKTILDAAEMCWEIGCTYKTLVNYIESRGLPCKNIGSGKRAQYLFLRSEVTKWLLNESEKQTARRILAEAGLS